MRSSSAETGLRWVAHILNPAERREKRGRGGRREARGGRQGDGKRQETGRGREAGRQRGGTAVGRAEERHGGAVSKS